MNEEKHYKLKTFYSQNRNSTAASEVKTTA